MVDARSIEALLFDLDGTLLDSDDRMVATLAQRMGSIGFREPLRAARRLVMALETPGNAFVTLLDLVGLDATLTGLTRRLQRWRGMRTPDGFLMVRHTRPALRALADRFRLAVVTTRGQREAQEFLKQFELQGLFAVLVTRESTRRLKPHPAPILYAARLLGIAPERCAMVGDTTVDVRAARRAGAWAIGVLCGFGERDELEQAGAHVILQSPAELPAALGLEPT
jgi:HAD superfamily hydrolase (TIGR01549 family)